jgi:hypothetical protein
LSSAKKQALRNLTGFALILNRSRGPGGNAKQRNNPRFPGFVIRKQDFLSHWGSLQEKSIATIPVGSQSLGSRSLRRWNSQVFRDQGVVLPSSESVQPKPAHLGVGGTRSRAINRRTSWNIYRGTATSAIWNVT